MGVLGRGGSIFLALVLLLPACGPLPTQGEANAVPSPRSIPSPVAMQAIDAIGPATVTPVARASTEVIDASAPSPTEATEPATPLPTRAPASATAAPPVATPTARPIPAPSPSPATGDARPGEAADGQPMRINFDYYVPYDATSWQTFQAQADQIDFVAPQWVTIDACGSIGSRDDRTLVAFARSKGVRVVPTLLTSSSWLNHQILSSPATMDRAVNQIVTYVVDEGYAGFDLDFENVPAGDRTALTRFVGQLSDALHAKGKLFTMALPSKRSDVTTGLAGAFDYAALAPHLDLAIIMTYGFSWSTSPPGSTAPQDWVDEVIAYTTSVIPAEKVLLGIPFYGYDWNLSQGGSARSLTYPQAAALANAYGATIRNDAASRSATFTYTAPAGQAPPTVIPADKLGHEIVERTQPACKIKPPAPPPAPTSLPAPTVAPGTPLHHEVWIENASSVAARLGLADTHGTAGIAVWRLGQEDPAVWPILADWRQGKK